MHVYEDSRHPDENFTTFSPDGSLSVAEVFLVGLTTVGSLLWSLLMMILRIPLFALDILAQIWVGT